jgi:hypothetical protein
MNAIPSPSKLFDLVEVAFDEACRDTYLVVDS